MQLFVGSKNPVKINSVITAASETWPGVSVVGIDVPSGVSVQPLSDAETRTGARNRALAALDQGVQQLKENALAQTAAIGDKTSYKPSETLGVGLEGGVFELDGELWSTVWVAVVDSEGTFYESNGARFKVPQIIAERIKKGEEMGPVVNAVIGQGDVRHSIGMIGVITNRFVDRTEEYGAIAKMALGLWYGRDWNKHLR
jgi:non-canonical (house-cleaning) NTP pyrophosphatase